jgi:UMF1 family MFS transporter
MQAEENRPGTPRYGCKEKQPAMKSGSSSSAPHSATRGQIFSWALFDFANTAFYVLILTVGYPLYFKEIVTGSSAQSDLLWGTAFSISMLVVALLSPILGAVADYGAGKKRFLGIFTLLCIVATSLLFFVRDGMVVTGMVLLILANIGFEAGLVFYDAFLPELTTERSYGRVSGYGFAVGYAGSLVTLAVAYPLYVNGFGDNNLLNVRISFLLAAAFFLLFAAPLFLFLPDKQRTGGLSRNFIRIGFERLRTTFGQFSRYRNVARFLLSFFLYIDAVNTIVVFSSIFARETLKMAIGEIVVFFLTVQTSAIAGSVIFGVVADHAGHKKTLGITLFLWLCIVGAAYVIQSKWLFYVLGFFAGIALGSSQSTSRSLMSGITPPEKKTEFFGFYSFFGKASAILGPFVFGLVSSYLNQRFAILSVGCFLLAGLLLLQRVEEHAPRDSSHPS